ncbi:MAG: DUF2807 domain-containing protein [Cyclobacteriaceae bacterium]|nr:DUF2807 domain-containing protein [Cyclobacteriaceae bacterium]
MKNANIVFALIYILTLFFQSCSLNIKRGNGNIEIYEIEIKNFNKINIGGNYDVSLIKSDDTKVIIETDENLLPYINTELFEQSLNINNVHNLKSSDGIKIEIYYKELNKIYSTGASNMEHKGILVTEELAINLSGVGAIDLEIQTTKVQVNLTGAGVVTLSGDTNFQETHISGAGGLRAFDLKSKGCSINLSGLGGAEVMATEKLEATITGVGGIIYAGNPKVIERQVTGFGKIKRAEEYINEENI